MRPRILIVDDDKTFADVLAELLEDEGYAAIHACDGSSAVQMLSSAPTAADIILCDVKGPGLSGVRFAAEVRRLFPQQRLPIVLMSAGADPDVKLRDVCFLRRPLDFGELLHGLSQLVERQPQVALATL
jgi:two-component system, cell cycle response regulator DivK